MELAAYLAAAATSPWQPGIFDCSAWPGRWAEIPLPAYTTDEEGQAHIEAAGGLIPLWSQLIGDRLQRASEPMAGDIGIIGVIDREHREMQSGAIFTGKRWAFVTPNGLACAHAEAFAVWRVPCPS